MDRKNRKDKQCQQSSVAEFLSVGFAEIKPPLQMQLIGYAIAIVLIAIEIFARFLKVRAYLQIG